MPTRAPPPCARQYEEIGLDRTHVEPLGYLDLYMTTLGYRIVPVIARVKPGFSLEAQCQRGRRHL